MSDRSGDGVPKRPTDSSAREVAGQDRKGGRQLHPPPRIEGVEPVFPPSAGENRASVKVGPFRTLQKERGHGWITGATFLVLVLVPIAVFFYLPRWVEQRGVTGGAKPPEKKEVILPPSESMTSEAWREKAYLKGRAEEALQRIARSMEILERKKASDWGGELYRAALASVGRGEERFQAKEYDQAAEAYRRAEEQLEAVHQRAREVFRQALEDGRRALEAGDAASASRAFGLAAEIEPDNSEVATGIERARVLDEVIALLVAGEELERNGDLQGAVGNYRKAVSLDPLSSPAQQGLARIDSRFADQAFIKTMSEAMAVLDRGDYGAAREVFLRAQAMRPNAKEVLDGLAQAEEGLRLQQIAHHREKALGFEKNEQWRLAAEVYQGVLELDSTIQFAREGKARCLERAGLSDRLDFHIQNPHRLSDERVLEAASLLLDTAAGVTPSGARLQQQVARLQKLIAEAATPITIQIESDELTDVVIYNVGRLGKFKQRSLELRPGTYTVVGTRRGFRDVRLQLVVAVGGEPVSLVVSCQEAI